VLNTSGVVLNESVLGPCSEELWSYEMIGEIEGEEMSAGCLSRPISNSRR